MIRWHRGRIGTAQFKLALIAGIGSRNLSKIEGESRRSHLDTYFRLCRILGIDTFSEVRP
ncbi:hypothetical protein [Paracoccus alkenifer]|uniref:hypothetical protein n=1 Tax=Paracoccus alkenifer TaxID=65735 RepID=UPI000B81CADC|nr:hypothetical protein [Paracoccus alkenifer]